MRYALTLFLLLLTGCAQQQVTTDRQFTDGPLCTVTEPSKSLAFAQPQAFASNYTISREGLNPYAIVGYDSAQVTTSYKVIDDYQSFSGGYGHGWGGYGGSYQRRAYEVVEQQRVR